MLARIIFGLRNPPLHISFGAVQNNGSMEVEQTELLRGGRLN
jgi:hypothetical protein